MGIWRIVARTFTRRKAAAAVAVASLALGIALNTSAFGVVNALWFRPLPFPKPERLVVLRTVNDKAGRSAGASLDDLRDWRERCASYEGMEGVLDRRFNLGEITPGSAAPEGVSGAAATPGAVSLQGFRPVAGRAFAAGDDAPGVRVAMLGEMLWRNRFGGDAGIIGREILLDGERTTVVGVLPRLFQFVYGGYQVVVPLRPEMLSGGREARELQVVARLREGVSLEAAQKELDSVSGLLAATFPAANRDWQGRVGDYRKTVFAHAAQMYPLLLAAAWLVLLIVCANVSNILLAEATARRREIAVRAALGAGRARIVRQLLGEGTLLALAGGTLAFLAAVWARDALVAAYPELRALAVDFRVFAYTLAVTLAAGVAFSLAPAVTASRVELNEAVKGSAREGGAGGHRLRRVLVTVQLALSLALLAGTGMLIRTAVNLRTADPGFRTERLLTASLVVRGSNYASPAEKLRLLRRVQSALLAAPGVESVAMGSHLPLFGGAGPQSLELAGVAVERCRAGQVQVMPGYHEAMGVRILAGRAIETGDSENAEPVAVINEALARVLWKGEMAQALGRQIRLGGGPWRRIVGVAADVQQVLVRPVAPEAAIPMAQQPAEAVALAIRTRGDAAVFSGPLRRAAAAVDPALPVGDIAPMESIVADYFPRVMTVGLAIFALAATLLASIGLYGVVAFSTERRRREIGIRVALGAERLGIVRLVVSESLRLALYGVAAGLVAAFAVARVLAGFLYGVGSGDLLVFGSVSLLMLAVAAAAGYLPARRAAAGDPVAALREE